MQRTEGTKCPSACFQVCRVLSPDWADENPPAAQRFWGADNPSCSQVMDIPHCWKCGMDWTDWITNETDAGCSDLCLTREKMRTWFKLSEGLGAISITGGIFSVAWQNKIFCISESRGNVLSMKGGELPAAGKIGILCGVDCVRGLPKAAGSNTDNWSLYTQESKTTLLVISLQHSC